MDLQNDAAKNSLWRSSTIITPRMGGSNSHHGKGKAPMPAPMSKRPQTTAFGQNTFGIHGSFGASTSKGVSKTMKLGGHSKSAKVDFKESSKSVTFNKHSERERSDNVKNYDSFFSSCACSSCSVAGNRRCRDMCYVSILACFPLYGSMRSIRCIMSGVRGIGSLPLLPRDLDPTLALDVELKLILSLSMPSAPLPSGAI